ncbi:hypothetical protein [Shimwellia blattae]|uniref:Glucosamine inositolphosphorylceramide transferase 1 N-terminal domain-containing protein n=1 Tax=Shimwellia blattae (strain ATCC 29907 / DSM 4481 / JCM 1650 / NBRC 105725 / CDC 9005-74) TaxID=630626 RepID=I2B8B1_SHIBC|nr:hypothetical protein [Shimwellia blattae]AFJ46765.1 hypothetical protein EBL_c16710 [Shimwellia blattae DSM 4481 = NBRC 105725]GAB82075.1 hypothetical protein EB105725_19_00680 [Shimwellia blattae DSM 4481 = NBRC 105725]VDY64244.1 Uncharacterised protein [Shimwellia blattae]VEC22369.1 Uncharacterised protein [Shimwellia blattae]
MDIFVTELWRIGIVQAPVQQIAAAGGIENFAIKWIEPDRPLCFLADPFGYWHEGRLYLFAEAYDYRTRHGDIVVFVLDEHFNVTEQRTVLSEPWHLSYPCVFQADGEIWMLPEGYKSGTLSLYRAVEFPWRWEKAPEFSFPCAAIDPSPFFTAGCWWMFYTPPAPKAARTSALMLARADTLFGPWENVSPRPVVQDKSGARMGGTPFICQGKLILPTQDCSKTYGGALQLLELSPDQLDNPVFTRGARLQAPASHAPFCDGLHTLSAAGEVTLIDTRRTLYGSLRRIGVDIRRALHKRMG